jgi:uncharacterized membrane protein
MLGIAGITALFAPELILSLQKIQTIGSSTLLVQLLGALYFGFAMMNWTVKDSAIGGIYARPVSLANFSHFFSGALLLVKYLFASLSPFVLVLTVIYILYALGFYWLVFHATGLKPSS